MVSQLRRAFVLLMAGAGVVFFGGTADAAPFWQAVHTNSTWHCGPTTQHLAVANVFFQACVVKSAADFTQPVLVVSNRSGRQITIAGIAADLFNGDACGVSAFNTGLQTGCFGPTTQMPRCSENVALGSLAVNGIWQDSALSPFVTGRCP